MLVSAARRLKVSANVRERFPWLKTGLVNCKLKPLETAALFKASRLHWQKSLPRRNPWICLEYYVAFEFCVSSVWYLSSNARVLRGCQLRLCWTNSTTFFRLQNMLKMGPKIKNTTVTVLYVASTTEVHCTFPWSWYSLKYIKNDLVKYLPEGAVGDQEEMAQLDGEPILCCGPEAAKAPFVGQQWGERRDSAVDPEQEQLPDTHVEPAGGERQHQPPNLSIWSAGVKFKVPFHLSRPTRTDQSGPSHLSNFVVWPLKMRYFWKHLLEIHERCTADFHTK